MPAPDHRGKVVIVTGASSGIGYETAQAFARRGSIIVAVARREERLQELVGKLQRDSPESCYLAGDLGQRGFAEEVVQATGSRYGGLDVLINNAGVSNHQHVFHLSVEEAESVMQVNFLSAVWTTLAALPWLLARGGGSIVNVSSFAAKVTPPREAIYAASKAAMNAFTQGLGNDLAGSNIHAAIVNPGPIDTEIWQNETEPGGYDGIKHPPGIVVDAIFEAIEMRRHELTAPKRDLALMSARALQLLAPSLLRAGMARTEPVSSDLIERAKERAMRRTRSES